MATTVFHTWQELINHPELITNYYLYGQATKPTASELLSDKWVRQQGVVDITIKISNYDSYISEGPGRYANASKIEVVSGFFESSFPNLQIGEKVTYSLSEAIGKYGENGTDDFAQTDFNGSLDGTNGSDYAARVYVFQTQKYLLNQNAKFIIERKADGQYVKRIENFALLPLQDDFDFNGGSFLTNLGNSLIEEDIDPSSLGRKVNIQYPSSTETSSYSTSTYTSASYVSDQTRIIREDHGTYLDAYQPIKDLVANMWSNGTTKFIDPQGRAILYGTTTSNQLSADAHSAFAYDSYMQEYYWANLQKGIAMVAGGGSDTLRGGAHTDYLLGGAGFDTYYSGNGDTIKDSDGKGKVAFEGSKLSGGVADQGGCQPNGDGEYRGDGGVYKLSGGKLTFTKDGTNETLTVQNFRNGDLGITLSSKDPGGSCPPPPPPAPNPYPGRSGENFSSPLVLDLNGDGVTSTFISETSTYFDLDNDGVRQRTGWVQADDALLVFDKNQDGKINNGTELFGNHTTLKNGTKAANGFEALKEYDENRDGVIDAKDNIYNTLSLWQDSNSDGVTDTGELHTLNELGVASINLGYSTNTDTLEERNAINQTSTFTMSSHPVLDTGSNTTNGMDPLIESGDDEIGIMRDVLFRYENTSKPSDGVYFITNNLIQKKAVA